jgi:hypothetical protein
MEASMIMSIVSLALKLLDHFIKTDESEVEKLNIPEPTKTKLAVLRAKHQAKKHYMKYKKDEV